MKKVLLIVLAAAALIFIKPGYEFNTKNRIISKIKIWDSIELDYSTLHDHLNESIIKQRYDKLKLNCAHDTSSLGDKSCYTFLRNINGIASWDVVFFFSKNRLQHVKVDILPTAHKAMVSYLNRKYGKPVKVPRKKHYPQLIGWKLPNGLISTNPKPDSDELSQFLWSSREHAYITTSQ